MKVLSKDKILLCLSAIFPLILVSITRASNFMYFSGFVFLVCVIYISFKNYKISKELFRDKKVMILSLIIEFCIFIDFFTIYEHSVPSKFQNIPFINPVIILAIIGIVFCLFGFLAVAVLSEKLLYIIKTFVCLVKEYKYHFLLLFGILLVSSFSIFRANFYYIDDIKRAVEGYEMTGNFSRYVADFLSRILHMNFWLADISPLPQIIALLILSFSGIILLNIFVVNKKPSLFSIVSVIPLAINPYFLRCLAYKYDAPYMALSIFISVLPFLFYKGNLLKFGVISFFSTIIMCTTYQASSGIFPLIAGCIGLLMWNKGDSFKSIIRFIGVSAVSYIIAMLLFRFLFMIPIDSSNYVSTEISIAQIPSNLIIYLKTFLSDMNEIWLVIMAVVLISFIYIETMVAKRNKIVVLIVNISMIILLFLVSFGVYCCFENCYTNPRYLYGVFVLVSIFCIRMFNVKKVYVGKVASLFLGWSFIIFTLIFGNALSLQKYYTDFRTEQVATAISESGLLKDNTEMKLLTKGKIGLCKPVGNMAVEYPILKKLIPVMLTNSAWYWGNYQISNLYNLNVNKCAPDEHNKHLSDLKLIRNNDSYKIESDNKEYIQITLKNSIK